MTAETVTVATLSTGKVEAAAIQIWRYGNARSHEGRSSEEGDQEEDTDAGAWASGWSGCGSSGWNGWSSEAAPAEAAAGAWSEAWRIQLHDTIIQQPSCNSAIGLVLAQKQKMARSHASTRRGAETAPIGQGFPRQCYTKNATDHNLGGPQFSRTTLRNRLIGGRRLKQIRKAAWHAELRPRCKTLC